MKRLFFLPVIGCSLVWTASAQDATVTSSVTPRELVPRIVKEIVKELERDLAGWYPRCIDAPENSGH